MSEKNKDLPGVLFRNNKKETEKHPDYTGSMIVKGTDYWLSAWVNESKEGKKYFSLKLTEKQAKAQDNKPVPEEPPAGSPQDDLPF